MTNVKGNAEVMCPCKYSCVYTFMSKYADKTLMKKPQLLKIPRTAPFVLVFCFAGNVKSRSAAGKPTTMRENLFVSLLILVWIVVGFSTHILSTDQTCSLRMITGFLSGG